MGANRQRWRGGRRYKSERWLLTQMFTKFLKIYFEKYVFRSYFSLINITTLISLNL